jgi:ATP-dependent DNA ligase
MPPVLPMLAKAVPHGRGVPAPDSIAGGLVFEPKWDGFRCVVFRDGDEVELGSRTGKSLTRYFPEIVEQVRDQLPTRCVLDGELIVIDPVAGDRLAFERLGDRVHPAASRIARLSVETPASLVVFDLLALNDEDWMVRGFGERRAALERELADVAPPIYLTAITGDHDLAQRWFTEFEGAGLDGVIAKPLAAPYAAGKRTLLKIKHERTADVVVAGYRTHTSGPVVGSLLLGLVDDVGRLQYVGGAAAFSLARRQELADELADHRIAANDHPWSFSMEGDRRPGALNRWTAGKDTDWVPLRPELVCEVGYDSMEGQRFRHSAQFRRWRPDREASSCGYDQLDRPVRYDLAEILAQK